MGGKGSAEPPEWIGNEQPTRRPGPEAKDRSLDRSERRLRMRPNDCLLQSRQLSTARATLAATILAAHSR